MSTRYFIVILLLGLGLYEPASGLDVSRFGTKRPDKISSQIRKAVALAQLDRQQGPLQHAMRWFDGQAVEAFVYHHCHDDEPLLKGRVFGMSYVRVDHRTLDALAELECVRQIRPPVYAHRRIGSVTSAGDIVMRAEEMRSTLGVDGSNIRIGIISDSFLNLPASVETGDLPPDVIIVNGRDGSDEPGTINEGQAMAELIYDLAPGATLLFHTGVPSSLDMIAGIRALTAAGADVIVDDLGFLLEPYFEDGPVAQAVQEAIDAGVLYVTAAGNDAETNYRGTFRELEPDDDDPQNNIHDFGGGDGTMRVTIPPGSVMQAVLQWPNPFDGSANTADYDLFVLSTDGTANACLTPGLSGVCVSDDAQLEGPLSPVEAVFVQNNTTQSVSLNLVVNRYEGEVLPLRIILGGRGIMDEYNVESNSVFGHPCVPDAMAVGAINASDLGFDTIEPFSSRGPCEIFFAPSDETAVASTGNDRFLTSQVVMLTPAERRDKPDVVAADGINTSLPFFTPFFGTSAAAPHAAAVAALLMELGGGPSVVSASQVLDLMRYGAVDLGSPGVDDTYGFGRVDAVEAAEVLQDTPQATILAPPSDVVATAGDTVTFQGMCTDVGSHGPFTFIWDFGGGADVAISTAQNPSVVFPAPGTFTVTLTCSNVLGFASATTPMVILINETEDQGGGGGGCALVTDTSVHPLNTLGHLCLPILALWGWKRWCRRRTAKSTFVP